MSAATANQQPVIVVGAGPVGLSAALALRSRNLPAGIACVGSSRPCSRSRGWRRAGKWLDTMPYGPRTRPATATGTKY